MNEIKKKVSFRGIFYIYNWSEIQRTLPFWISLYCALIYLVCACISCNNQRDFAQFLLDFITGAYPDLLGFSLGGYAIIVSFGNTDFLRRIAKSGENYFELLNAIFAFSILLQVAGLLLAFVGKSFVHVWDCPRDFDHFPIYQIFNGLFSAITIFVIVWGISLIPYVVSNIFIFGQTHHELLKHDNPDKPPGKFRRKP